MSDRSAVFVTNASQRRLPVTSHESRGDRQRGAIYLLDITLAPLQNRAFASLAVGCLGIYRTVGRFDVALGAVAFSPISCSIHVSTPPPRKSSE
jgi:hypothetical protein